jgi:FKBP-type peptidyl-prolyl cis-trans isomerase FkpA
MKRYELGLCAGILTVGTLFPACTVGRKNESDMKQPEVRSKAETEVKSTPDKDATKNWITIEDGLVYQITKEGSADAQVARSGSGVTVHYTGWLEKGAKELGQKFDSSHDHGQPFAFNLGAGQVIAGWDKGVCGMKIGEKRRLVISSKFAYGKRGVPGAIPPDATLIFDVELLEIN